MIPFEMSPPLGTVLLVNYSSFMLYFFHTMLKVKQNVRKTFNFVIHAMELCKKSFEKSWNVYQAKMSRFLIFSTAICIRLGYM